MGRKRNPKEVTPWERIHDRLADIMMAMKYKKTTREHIKLTYFGTAKELRKQCIAILNQIDLMKEENENGLSAEDRWT